MSEQQSLPLKGGILAEPTTALAVHEQPLYSLISQALSDGREWQTIKELVGLQRELAADSAQTLFAKAMHACQQEMPTIVRDAENSQTRSRFALLETIQKKAKPIYSKHGFSLIYGEADCPLPGHKRTICDCVHTAGHIRSYHLDLPVDGVGPKGNPIGGMNSVQGAISTTSYGQRRLCCMIFNITLAGEDDDGQSAETRVPISDEQYATLLELIEASGADLKRFLACYQVEKLGDLPQTKFDDALAALKRKMASKR